MTNHENRSQGKFELTFFGGTQRRYRRWHDSFEAARSEAARVLADMGDGWRDEQRNAHPAIVYGTGCGRDGHTLS